MPGPAGTPVTLTLSGNEITDAVRAATTSGDGLSPEGSMGVWEATTNLLPNGGAESNLTSITYSGGGTPATFARSSTYAKFGTYSVKVDGLGDGATQGITYQNTTDGTWTAGDAGTASVWVYHEGPGSVTFEVLLDWRLAGGGANGAAGTGSVSVPANTWTRLSVTGTAPASTSRAYLKVYRYGTVGSAFTFYADGAQTEKQPLATPYVETNGGTASRTIARVQVPVGTAIDETQMWVAFRLRMGWGNSNEPGLVSPGIFSWGDNVNNRLELHYDETNNRWETRRVASGVADVAVTYGKAYATGDLTTVIWKISASTNGLSVDGGTFVTVVPTPSVPVLSATLADLGREELGGSGRVIDGDIFWFACGTGTLTDADAAAIHANGNIDPSPGLFPTAATLKMIWKGIDSQARRY